MVRELPKVFPPCVVQVSLIYPFRWCHTAIPVLPRGLLEVLQSPMPFILGMHLEQWHEAVDEIPPWVVQACWACVIACKW